jgi:O-antigen ligase
MLLAFALTVDVAALPELVGRESHLSGRTFIWASGLELALQRPLHGFGYSADTEALAVTHWVTSFHNGYLEFLVKLGVVGLALLLMMFALFWRQQANRRPVGPEWVLTPIVGAILIYNLTESAFFSSRNPTWLIAALALYISALRSARDGRRERAVTGS